MHWVARLVPLALVALTTGSIHAQSGPPRRDDALLGVTTPPATDRHDPLLDPPMLIEKPSEKFDRWRVSADFGLPIGLRLQRRLGDSNLWGEVGAGAWWIVPYASTCLRYDCTLLKRERNLFAVRPGVSATYVLLGPNLGVGVDSEFVWQHTFGGKVTTELGVRLGLTTVFANSSDRWGNGVFPVPVMCLMWTCQF